MKIKDIAKKLTKKEFVEFLDEIDIISDGCPSDLGLRENNVISNIATVFVVVSLIAIILSILIFIANSVITLFIVWFGNW